MLAGYLTVKIVGTSRISPPKRSTYLVLIVRLAVVGGTNSEDDDHDQQSSARRQDGYQGFVIRRSL